MRLILLLIYECIIQIDLHLGLLHRGTEKLIEHKTWIQAISYYDRLDYVSTLCQEDSFINSIELECELEELSILKRILLFELVRVSNHLLAVACHIGDLGALSFILWYFEDRERLFDLLDRLTGARMHVSYFRIARFSVFNNSEFMDDVITLSLFGINRFEDCFDVCYAEIVRLRLVHVMLCSLDELEIFSFSGPMIRSFGISWDLRSDCSLYHCIVLMLCYSTCGDSFDRLLIRLNEIKESYVIAMNCVLMISFTFEHFDCFYGTGYLKWLLFGTMELIIKSFFYGMLLLHDMLELGFGFAELPKGEFVVVNFLFDRLISLRNRIRSTGFIYLTSFIFSSKGILLSDLITCIGTIDIVFGEVDR